MSGLSPAAVRDPERECRPGGNATETADPDEPQRLNTQISASAYDQLPDAPREPVVRCRRCRRRLTAAQHPQAPWQNMPPPAPTRGGGRVRPLHIPQLDPDTDTLTAALAYAAAGFYVLPAKRGTKDPGSIVSKGWHHKSSRDPKQITAWFAGTDHDIALHCGRSGAAVFDVDNPNKLPDVLRKHLWAAPFQSTRPDTPGRGHYVFTQPPGRTIGNSTGRLGGAWGQVRGLNGVIIVAPSFHANGGHYQWQNTGAVPELPNELAELLDDTTPSADAATDEQVAEFLAEHTTATRPDILNGLKSALLNKIAANESRHDSTLSTATGAMKEARAGYYSAESVIDTLKPIFTNSVQLEPRQRTPAAAQSEWNGIVAWAVAQALTADLDEIHARVAEKMPEGTTTIDAPKLEGASEPGSPDPEPQRRRHIKLVRATDIRDAVPIYVWTHNSVGRVQLGTLALDAGRPGCGKSTHARYRAAGY
jgi:hypothetical protein